MPVSPWPILFPAILICIPLFSLFRGRLACCRGAAVSAAVMSAIFLWVYLPGGYWWLRAVAGDRVGMYEMARWTESHDEEIGKFILWPFTPNVYGGYAWLEKSAALDYPPALYALGLRLKQGFWLPEPPNWHGPGGNVFPQPERGQPLIDKAIQLGYQPVTDETYFYFSQYRY